MSYITGYTLTLRRPFICKSITSERISSSAFPVKTWIMFGRRRNINLSYSLWDLMSSTKSPGINRAGAEMSDVTNSERAVRIPALKTLKI